MAKKKKYKLLHSTHQLPGKGKIYRKGDTIETDIDLIKQFPDQFKIAGKFVEEVVDTDPEELEGSDTKFGVEVTDKFEGAEGVVQVLKKGRKYNVLDLLGEEVKLDATKAEVEAIISDLTKAE